MRKILILTAALLVPATAQVAVAWGEATPEIRMFAGAYVPIGDQADVLKTGFLVGAQAGFEVIESFHLLGTFAYTTPSPDRPTIGNDVHIYQYDVGAEYFRTYGLSEETDHWTWRPFGGVGLGGRTYDLHGIDAEAQTNFVGYGSLGFEVQHQNIAARFEARDYLSRFKGLTGLEDASTRNDLVLGGGFSFHF